MKVASSSVPECQWVFLTTLVCLLLLSADPARANEPVSSRIELSGRIMDSHGEPLPQAEVSVAALAQDTSSERRDQGILRTNTAKDGSFSFSVSDGIYRLEVKAPGFEAKELLLPPVFRSLRLPPAYLDVAGGEHAHPSPQGPETSHPAWLPVREYRTETHQVGIGIVGRVVAASDRSPIQGAWVWVPNDPFSAVRTDAEGTYHLEIRDASLVVASAPGYSKGQLGLRVDQESPRTNFALESAPYSLWGVIVGTDGLPISDIVVSLERDSFPMPFAVSNERGQFVLADIPRGGPHKIHLNGRGWASLTREFRFPGVNSESAPIEFALSRASRLEGTIVDPFSNPVPSAHVLLRSYVDSPALSETLADQDGRFEMPDISSGSYFLEVRAKGFAHRQVNVDIGSEVTTRLGKIQLEAAAKILGRVLGEESAPLQGVAVLVDRSPQSGSVGLDGLASDEPETWTASDGSFEVGSLAEHEQVALTFQKKGYIPSRRVFSASETRVPVTVEMEKSATIRGRVVDSDGVPILGARIFLTYMKPMGMEVFEQATGEMGNFSFDIRPEPFRIGVAAKGHQIYQRKNLLPEESEDAPLEIQLAPGASLSGRVFRADGTPASRAKVWVDLPEQTLPNDLDFFLRPVARSDGNGYYLIDGLPAAELLVEASHEQNRAVASLHTQPGNNSLDLTLSEPRRLRISGRLVGEQGHAQSMTELALLSLEDGQIQSTSTDSEGFFQFDELEEGDYRIRLGRDLMLLGQDDLITLRRNLENLRWLTTEAATVHGRLMGFSAIDDVRVVSSSPKQRVMIDREAQTYRIEGLPPGSWVIEAKEPGQGGVQESIHLEPGAEIRLDLVFDLGLLLSGRVLDDSGAFPGAMVQAIPQAGGSPAWTVTDANGAFELRLTGEGKYLVRVLDRSPSRGTRHEQVVTADSDMHLDVFLSEE